MEPRRKGPGVVREGAPDAAGRVRVFVADGEFHARQISAFLEADGIKTNHSGESVGEAFGLVVGDLATVEVLVPEADAERARALLESAEAGQFRLGDDEPIA